MSAPPGSVVVDLAAVRSRRAHAGLRRWEEDRRDRFEALALGVLSVLRAHDGLSPEARAAVLMTAALDLLRDDGPAAQRNVRALMDAVIGQGPPPAG